MSAPDSDLQKRRRHRNERIAAALLVVTLGAVVGGFVLWNRAEERALRRDQTYVPKPATITPEILLLQEYVRIDTSTVEGVAAGAHWLARQLQARGIEPEIIESTPGHLNVYARIKGRRDGGGLLLFNHIDVVPPGEGWEVPPFEGAIRFNMLYGRGVLDMKALAVAQLLAFAGVAQSGRQPEHDLAFLATAEEERGSVHGMRWLLANRPDVFEGIAYGITEGGITEMQAERMTYFGIEIGGKRFVSAELSAASIDAARAARIALEPYIVSREPGRVIPEVAAYFRRIAPRRPSFGGLLEDIDRTIAAGAFWRLPVAYRDLTQNTIWVSAPRQAGGGSELTVQMLNLPDEDPDERLAWLAGVVTQHGVQIAAVTQKEEPVSLSPVDTRLFSILAEEATLHYETDAGAQVLFRSTNDSRLLRPLGIASYGISPYPVEHAQSVSIHASNERIRTDAFPRGIAYLTAVVQRWSAGDN